MRRDLLCVFLLVAPLLALGQTSGPIVGPSAGFVFDSNVAAVRSLPGIPGSATIGPPVDVGFPLANAISLPDQRHLLAVPEAGATLLVVDMGMTPPSSSPIVGTAKSAEITLSPNGTTAALANPSGKIVQVVTGLPDHAAVVLELSTAQVQSSLLRVAVNDGGDLLLMAFQGNDRETIYRWNGTEGFRPLASVARVGALSFIGASDAVYADSSSKEVFLARDLKTQAGVEFLAGPADGVSDAVAAVASAAGGFFLANADTGTVITFGANRQILRVQECGCKLSGLHPLGAGLFRLTDRLNQTIQLLYDNNSEPRLIFIPPLQ